MNHLHWKLLVLIWWSLLLSQVHSVTFHNEDDGSLTVVYKMMEGTYTNIESHRRRLSEVSQTQLRTLILDKHNQLRAKTANGLAPCRCGSSCGTGHGGAGYHPGATNMNALFWDAALERVAQQYATRCLFQHNTQRTAETLEYRYLASWAQSQEKYIGENLFISSTGRQVWNNIFGETDYGIEGGLQGWWDECIDYELTEGGSCGDDIEHYTQYVRADARLVGCGVGICPYGVQTRTGTETWANLNVVCNYVGGQYGDRPYDIAENAQQVASQCDPDRIAHFGLHGLCGGPQARDWYENPQTKYDKTSFPTEIWICDDGTGRDMCSDDGTVTPTTETPTNNPITPQLQPTRHVVTPMPTHPTQRPTTRPPTRVFTKRPTPSPPTTRQPAVSPVDDTDNCDLSYCTFTTDIMWRSERKKYRGFVDAAWTTERDVLDLLDEETWGGKWSYSWGGHYERSEENGDGWVLYIWDTIDIEWEEMPCDKQTYYSNYMTSAEFEERIKSGIEEIMGSETGQVTEVTVHVSCNGSDAAAFGMIEKEGKAQIPFAVLNLNSYDWRDWFFVAFCLWIALCVCFACGYRMHRSRVLSALEHGAYGEYERQETITLQDGDGHARTQNALDNYSVQHRQEEEMEEIQIGVSMDTTQGNIILCQPEWE